MKLSSGKRIGQSGGELAAAALFSFFLHAILLAAAFFFVQVSPKKSVPLFYEVKLVGPQGPTEIPQATPESHPAPVQKAKALPKAKKAAPKEKRASPKTPKATLKAKAGKSPMPEMVKPAQKPVPSASVLSQEMPAATTPPPAGGKAGGQEESTAKSEGVAVSTSQQGFKDAWYLNLVRDKISQNWRPPPDAPDARARVIFSINRSGWIGEVNLDGEHSAGTFGFKQAAIRAVRASNPFPRLPDEFSKQTLEFSVDLMAE